MFNKIIKSLVFILFLPIIACSTPPANGSFQAGREYQVLPGNTQKTTNNNKIVVIEFFSYGCPWCYHVEPELEKWLANKPKDIEFERVPVVFEQGWDTLAKIYYTTKSLNISEKMMMPIFKAVQEQDQNLTDAEQLKKFLAANGINQNDFDNAYDFSPGIDGQMMRGEKLMRDHGVYAIPSFVINGKYSTSMGMANGDTKRLMKIVEYLVNKERQGDQIVAR